MVFWTAVSRQPEQLLTAATHLQKVALTSRLLPSLTEVPSTPRRELFLMA